MAGRRSATRTQPCSVAQARTRLEHSRKFLEVAELVAGETGEVEYASAAAALAVLAGIAASDAACCAAWVGALADRITCKQSNWWSKSLRAALRRPKHYAVY